MLSHDDAFLCIRISSRCGVIQEALASWFTPLFVPCSFIAAARDHIGGSIFLAAFQAEAAGNHRAAFVPSSSAYADESIRAFRQTPPRTCKRRHCDGCLYIFSLLMLSGMYRIY